MIEYTKTIKRKGEIKMDNRYYIVRGNRSGVFFGRIVERSGQETAMSDVRKLWYWDGATTVNQLAKDGTKKPENCKFTASVDELTITDAIEIIPCTPEATENIKAVRDWAV